MLHKRCRFRVGAIWANSPELHLGCEGQRSTARRCGTRSTRSNRFPSPERQWHKHPPPSGARAIPGLPVVAPQQQLP
jgi:hypothetical protein